jgi:hypothetical protein
LRERRSNQAALEVRADPFISLSSFTSASAPEVDDAGFWPVIRRPSVMA